VNIKGTNTHFSQATNTQIYFWQGTSTLYYKPLQQGTSTLTDHRFVQASNTVATGQIIMSGNNVASLFVNLDTSINEGTYHFYLYNEIDGGMMLPYATTIINYNDTISAPVGIFNIKSIPVGVSKLDLYPNPSDGTVNLKAPMTDEYILSVSVYDYLGRMVLRKFSPGQTSETLEGLKPGMYEVIVNTTKSRYNEKLIIK
jgi:hypothetical protein